MKNKVKKTWIKDKTVVITGASGGLGFSMSKMLIEKYGAKVIGICRNEQKMLASLKKLQFNKENFSYRVFDVRDNQKWELFYNELVEKNIPVDVLINNAGFMLPFVKFEDISDSEIEEIIDTNFKANLKSIRTLLPLLKKSKYATICNIISSAGNGAVVGESMYCATKFAMKGLTDTIRVEYSGKIKVTGIYPGFIKTDILQRQKVDTKNNKVINFMMSPLDKITKKSVKAIIKQKKTLVTGFDGKMMTFFGKRFPHFTATMIAKVFKLSKQSLFDELFDKREN